MGPLHSCVCVCTGVLLRSIGYSVTVSVFSLGRVFVLQAAGEALLFNLVKRIILKAKALNSTVRLHWGVVSVCACRECVCVRMSLCVSASLFSAYAPRIQQAVALLSYYSYKLCLHSSCEINLGEKRECCKNRLQIKIVTFPTPMLERTKSSLLWKLATSSQNSELFGKHFMDWLWLPHF